MRPRSHSQGGRPRANAIRALVVCTAMVAGCTSYKEDTDATGAIWTVRVTTSAQDVAQCRLIRHVDSRDAALGCGLTVQPTPEECLRYQVKRAGGDTLLMRGPAGEAYDCSGGVAASPTPSATAAPPPQPTATPAPAPPAAAPPPPPAPAATPKASRGVRITDDRGLAKGCVYLGEAEPGTACGDDRGEATGACADRALEAGGDLIVRDGARAQIFSCKARP